MICSSVALGSDEVYGELELQSIYENEPDAGRRYFKGLTYENAYKSLSYIQAELIYQKEFIQYIPFEKRIGVSNHYNKILLTLMRQNYTIKKLEYEIAKQKYKDKEINETTLRLKQDIYQKAKTDFEKYYNSIKLGE